MLVITNNPKIEKLPLDSSYSIEKVDIKEGCVYLYYKQKNFVFTLSDEKASLQCSEMFEGVDEKDRIESELNVVIDKVKKEIYVKGDCQLGLSVYYHVDSEGYFYIATDIDQLGALTDLNENLTVLPEVFTFRSVVPPQTLWADVYLLGLFEDLKYSIESNEFEVILDEKYIDPKRTADGQKNADNIHDLLNDNIKSFIPMASQVTSLLSGGMDSSLLSAMLKNNLGQKDSYSADYPDAFEKYSKKAPEEEYALSAAEAIGTNHTSYKPSVAEYFEGLVEATKAAQMPILHLQSVLLFNLFKNGIADNHSLVLCGQGGDSLSEGIEMKDMRLCEEAYGYWKFLPFKKLFKSVFKRVFKKFNKGYAPYAYLTKCHLGKEDYDFSFYYAVNYSNRDYGQKILNFTKEEILKKRIDYYKRFERAGVYDFIGLYVICTDVHMTKVLWGNLGRYNNKSIYYPYCLESVMDEAMTISNDSPMRRRDTFMQYIGAKNNVPEFILNRKKLGFKFDWRPTAKADGVLVHLAKDLANGPLADKQDFDLLTSRNTSENVMTLWTLVAYFIWRKIFIEKEDVNVLKKRVSEIAVQYF